MVLISAGRRWLPALTTASIAAGLVTTLASVTPAAASTCPKVSSTGVVTPAPSPGVDWSGCPLGDANLSGADLSGANLSGAKLVHANMTNANLTSANLTSVRLDRTTITGATLTSTAMAGGQLYLVISGQITGTPASFPGHWSLAGGYLIGPYDNLDNASLAGVNLSGADLANAIITQADLSDADLLNADLSQANLGGSNLSGANLTDANLNTFSVYNLTLTGANLSGTKFAYNGDLSGVVSGGITGTPANLPYYPNGQYVIADGYLAGPGADLASADLAGANLTGASLVGNANLSGADLTGANLTDGALSADLAGTKLADANLKALSSFLNSGTPASLPAHWAFVGGYLFGPTVFLTEQDLHGYDLSGLDLAGAGLSQSNLTGANLTGTDLAKAVLWFSNLTSATVTGANFTGATWTSTICPNGTNSNLYIDGCFSPRDTTAPVLHLNVRNRQVFAVGMAPAVRCTATDKDSPVIVDPTLKITGRLSHGLGKLTATCRGAADPAGNVARPVSATYSIAYGFGGMTPPQGSTVPARPRTLTVSFSLFGPEEPIPAATARAMVHRHDVRVTLRGPGVRPTTAVCGSYSSRLGFVCKLRLPQHVRTGRRHRYTLTAYENDGFGFVVAPGEPTAENPVTIHFR